MVRNISFAATALVGVRVREKSKQNALKIYSVWSRLDFTWGFVVKTKQNKNCHHKLSIILLLLLIGAFTIIT